MPVAGSHRALLDLVVDLPEHAVRGRFALCEPHERLHLAHEAGCRRQHRMLAAEVAGVPSQHVAEQHGGLVVEVVTGRDDVVAVIEGDGVEEVPFGESARSARGPAGGLRRAGDVVAELIGEVDFDQRSTDGLGVKPGVHSGLVGVVADTEPEVETVGLVAEPEQQIPERERVFAARYGDEHPLPRCEHSMCVNGAAHLLLAMAEEVFATECGVVAAHVHDRRLTTHAALHAAPPEITGRISTASASSIRASRVTSSSPTMTSTDSGFSSRCCSSDRTVIGPRTSTSRRGLRNSTFTATRLPAYFVRGISRISMLSPDRSSIRTISGFLAVKRRRTCRPSKVAPR